MRERGRSGRFSSAAPCCTTAPSCRGWHRCPRRIRRCARRSRRGRREGWPALHAELARLDPAAQRESIPIIRSASCGPSRSAADRAAALRRCTGRPVPALPRRSASPWRPRSAPRCTRASPTRSTACWRRASSMRWRPARPRRSASGSAGDACRRLSPALGPSRRCGATSRGRASGPSRPRVSWPSASSPGCASGRKLRWLLTDSDGTPVDRWSASGPGNSSGIGELSRLLGTGVEWESTELQAARIASGCDAGSGGGRWSESWPGCPVDRDLRVVVRPHRDRLSRPVIGPGTSAGCRPATLDHRGRRRLGA
jgi:hypothetical protein